MTAEFRPRTSIVIRHLGPSPSAHRGGHRPPLHGGQFKGSRWGRFRAPAHRKQSGPCDFRMMRASCGLRPPGQQVVRAIELRCLQVHEENQYPLGILLRMNLRKVGLLGGARLRPDRGHEDGFCLDDHLSSMRGPDGAGPSSVLDKRF